MLAFISFDPPTAIAAPLLEANASAQLSFNPEDERWSTLIAAAAAPDRTRHALALFASRLIVTESLFPWARVLAWAAGTTRDGASTEGLVTPIQGARALAALAHAGDGPRAVVDELLSAASSDAERAVILKAVAARALDLKAPTFESDMRTLATEIHDKPLHWLLENTTCYGSDFGAGLTQAFQDSCMPAVKILAEAEADPLAALRLHALTLVDEEKRELEENGGVAVPRTTVAARGRGTRDHQLLFRLADDLGATTEVLDRSELDASALDQLERVLADGEDVPMRIATVDDTVAHSVIAVDVKRDGDKRFFRVHDPWTGRSQWFSDDAMLSDKLFPTDRGDHRRITHVYLIRPA